MLGASRIRKRAESERIHDRNRPRAHREDVPQDSANPCRSALKRLDVTRMIVRLDLERDNPTTPNPDNTGILTRPLHHVLTLCRELLQMDARAFIRKMLATHNAEEAELRVTRFASQQRDDFLILRGRELMLLHQLRCNGHFVSAGIVVATRDVNMDSKIPSPSRDPISRSHARSGCGIMPITLRSR